MNLRTTLVKTFSRRFMWQVLPGLHLALLMASSLLMTTATAQQPTKRVLIISAYDTNLPGFVALNRAIRSTVKDGSPGPVDFFYENHENKRVPIDRYEQELVSYLRLKYTGEKFDLIIMVGARSLKFLSSHKTELFPDTPKLYFFFDESEEIALSLMPDVTGIWAKADIAETVEIALALHPGTQRVVVVLGKIDSYKFRREQARSELQKYEGKLQIDYATDLTIEELKATLAALPKNTIVVYIQFSIDRLGNTFSGPEALSKIAPTSSAPIYGTASTFIGSGIVGGSVLDFDVLGAHTGELALRILAGEQTQNIRPQKVANVPVFDWRELRRWGISEGQLPPGSIVRFRVPSVWDQYKWYLLGIVFVILLQSALISGLLINRSRRQRAEEQNRKLIQNLGERVKELTALHLSARILHDEARTVADLLQTIVALLPPAFQYPDVTAARIRFGDKQFETPNFSPTSWSLVAPFTVGNLDCAIEVVHLEARPEETNGPFLSEEKNLIESLAEMLDSALNRRLTQEQLRALSGSVQAAREEEATRIAREIHDELGGSLTSLRWELEEIDEPLETGDRPDVQEQRKKVLSMVRVIDATINTVRRIASELRPIGLDELGLVAAIELYARTFQDRSGIMVECECALQKLDLSQEQSTGVFRIFQEALTNILRHSHATRVAIKTIEKAGEFILTIADNGRGITDQERLSKHTLGLLGMRERAHLMGGTIDITGSAGKGTVVTLRISTSSQSGTERSK